MHPQPPVQQSVAPKQSPQFAQPQPYLHPLIRSRNRYHQSNAQHNLRREVFIDVLANNAVECSRKTNEMGIRKTIDACLDAVESVHRQRVPSQQVEKEAMPSEHCIHRIDNHIVVDYIRTICKDYSIRDRFADFGAQQTPSRQGPIRIENRFESPPRSRNHSLATEKDRRQFLTLTQKSNKGRGMSAQKSKPEYQTAYQTKRQTDSHHGSPRNRQTVTPFHLQSRQPPILHSPSTGKVPQDFRYCINCELPILSQNVDFHQTYECSNFSSLYNLGFEQLVEVVGEKVRRMSGQLRERIEWLRGRDERQEKRFEKINNEALERMLEYANESVMNDSTLDRSTTEYSRVEHSLNNSYSEVVELTHKLHWFNQVLAKLRDENKKSENRLVIGIEQQPIAHIPLSKCVVPPSPISQLYPHLHANQPRVSRFA